MKSKKSLLTFPGFGGAATGTPCHPRLTGTPRAWKRSPSAICAWGSRFRRPPEFAGTGGPDDTVFFPGFGGASTGTPCHPRLTSTPRAWKRSPSAICAQGSRFRRPPEFADTGGPADTVFFLGFGGAATGTPCHPRLTDTLRAWKRSPSAICERGSRFQRPPEFADTGGPADTVFFPGFGGASTGTPCRPRLNGTPRAWKRSPSAICERGSRFRRTPEFAGTGGPADTVFFLGFGGAATGTPCRPRLAGTPRAWKRSPSAICERGSRFRRPPEFAGTGGPADTVFFLGFGGAATGTLCRPRLAGTPRAWKRSPSAICAQGSRFRRPPEFAGTGEVT
jgi:hypothetical protein